MSLGNFLGTIVARIDVRKFFFLPTFGTQIPLEYIWKRCFFAWQQMTEIFKLVELYDVREKRIRTQKHVYLNTTTNYNNQYDFVRHAVK